MRVDDLRGEILAAHLADVDVAPPYVVVDRLAQSGVRLPIGALGRYHCLGAADVSRDREGDRVVVLVVRM